MIKDTFFSFSRFGKLFYKEISENWKLYGLQVLVMYVAMAITLIWSFGCGLGGYLSAWGLLLHLKQ